MKYVKYIFFVILLLCLVAMVSCATAPTQNDILSAEIGRKGEHITLKATLTDEYIAEHKGEKIYLLALNSYHNGDIDDYQIVGSSKLRNNLVFRFDLESDAGTSLLPSAFVLARLSDGDEETGSFIAVTDGEYVSNPTVLSQSGKRPTEHASLKGLATSDVYVAELTGAEHILIELEINKILLSTYKEGAINHVYNNRSYYFDADEVSRLDKQVSESCKLGLRVYLRTVLKYPEADENGDYQNEPITALYCPGIGYNSAGYLPNMEDASAAGYINALYDLLASRYNGEYGVVLDYIIGRQANSLACGSYDADRAMDNYLAWVRSAYNILSAKGKNANVYVSTDNRLRSDSSAVIGTKVFLTNFAAKAKLSGDFPWQISLSLGSGDDLSAIMSGGNKDYSRLGLNDLAEFEEFLMQDDLLYGDRARRVILDLRLSNSLSEANRAAYYTYAYYTAAEVGYDALFFETDTPDCSLYNSSGTRTEFYYAFLMCGSNTASQLESFTQRISGADPDFKEYCTRYLIYQQEAVTEVGRAVANNKKSFPAALHDFLATAGTQDLNLKIDEQTGEQKLSAEGNIANSHMAISCYNVRAADLLESGYVGIRMSSPTTATVALVITDKNLANDKSAVFVGEARVLGNSTTYYFNISPFTDHIKASDTLTVSLLILPAESGTSTAILEVEEIALYGTSGNGSRTIVSIVVVAVSTLGICALLHLLTQRRKKHISREIEE